MKFCDSHMSSKGDFITLGWFGRNTVCFNCGNIYLAHCIVTAGLVEYSCGTPNKAKGKDQISLLLRFEHQFFHEKLEHRFI